MGLVGGTVAVTLDMNGAPVFAGSGLALAWAQASVAALLASMPALPTVGDTSAPYRPERPVTADDRARAIAARAVLFADKARDANAVAPMLVAYLQANAVVALGGVTSTLQVSAGQVPNPNTPGTPITPPAAPLALPLKGTGTLT